MSSWVLSTPRLRLRELTEADRPLVARLDWLDTERVMRRCLDDYRRHGHSLWAAEAVAGGEFIGLCGLLLQELEGRPELEVGYHLLPRHRGRGLATEAARGAMDFAFGRLAAGRIISIILPDNEASIAVAGRNGLAFERAARFRGFDVHIYAAAAPSGRAAP